MISLYFTINLILAICIAAEALKRCILFYLGICYSYLVWRRIDTHLAKHDGIHYTVLQGYIEDFELMRKFGWSIEWDDEPDGVFRNFYGPCFNGFPVAAE